VACLLRHTHHTPHAAHTTATVCITGNQVGMGLAGQEYLPHAPRTTRTLELTATTHHATVRGDAIRVVVGVNEVPRLHVRRT
jgi:hypothetical protein